MNVCAKPVCAHTPVQKIETSLYTHQKTYFWTAYEINIHQTTPESFTQDLKSKKMANTLIL